jgi:type 1 glutamine amidotransferase
LLITISNNSGRRKKGAKMIQRSKVVSTVLLVACCFLVFTNILQAAVSPAEVQKIEKAMPAKARAAPKRPRKLLVFNLCKGFKHGSIPYWDKALEIMGRKGGTFVAVVSDDMSMFRPENLRQFDAVCLNNTTRLTFEEPLRKSLMSFVKGGKGIVGIHAATDNFYDWPEAQEMMGGKFTGHPWGGGGTWTIKIDQPDHPLMAAFKGKGFKIKDEIYRTDPPLYSREKQLVLMSLDMSDEKTRNVGGFKPTDEDTGTGWIKAWGKGRVFYCSLGHNNEVTWNPPVLQHVLDGIQFAFGDFKVDTKPRPIISSGKEKEMEDLMDKVKTYDWGQSREALTKLTDLVRKAYGSPAELKRIEKSMLELLRSDATRAGKQFICRKLSIIGTEESVPTLGAMLTDAKTSDMARYALERIPGAAVDEALRNALPKTTGKTRVGIINTLGQRRDSRAVRALRSLIRDSDPLTAGAAVAALGNIAGPRATRSLAQAKDRATGKLRLLVCDAYLKCADELAVQGKKEQALAIYNELMKEPKPISIAALRGRLNLQKKVKK